MISSRDKTVSDDIESQSHLPFHLFIANYLYDFTLIYLDELRNIIQGNRFYMFTPDMNEASSVHSENNGI